MRTMVLAISMVGCVSTTRGPVDVVAFDNSASTAVPIAGALVVLQDTDGTTTTTTTDVDGHATGEVEDGGMVWLGADASSLRAYADVVTPATLVFGRRPPPVHTPLVTMTVTGSPPTPELVALYSSCGVPVAGGLQLDDRCSEDAPILAVGYTQQGGADVYDVYAYLPHVPMRDGGTIAIPDAAWMPLDTVSVEIVDLETATLATSQVPSIANDLGFSQTAVASDPATFTASLPLVGSRLQVSYALQRDSEFQRIATSVPASEAPVLDFWINGVPWIDELVGDSSFGLDDIGGHVISNASITTYTWSTNSLIVLGPPAGESGTIEMPRLPAPWSELQPGSGLEVSTSLRVVRAASTSTDPKVVAEESDLSELSLPDATVGSVAVSGPPE